MAYDDLPDPHIDADYLLVLIGSLIARLIEADVLDRDDAIDIELRARAENAARLAGRRAN